MAISVVQSTSNHTDSDTANVGITANFGSNITAGNTLVVCGFANSASGLAVSDTSGDAFTQIFSSWDGANAFIMQIWVCLSAAGGNVGGINVQKTAGTTNVQIIAYELSGVALDISNGLDKHPDTGATGAGTPSINFLTSYDNELIVVFSSQGNAALPTSQTLGSGAANLVNAMSSVSGTSGETVALSANADIVSNTSTTTAFGTSVTSYTIVALGFVPNGHKLFGQTRQYLRPHIFSPGLAR